MVHTSLLWNGGPTHPYFKKVGPNWRCFSFVVFIMVIGTILVGPCFGARGRKLVILMEIIGEEGILKMKGHKGTSLLWNDGPTHHYLKTLWPNWRHSSSICFHRGKCFFFQILISASLLLANLYSLKLPHGHMECLFVQLHA